MLALVSPASHPPYSTANFHFLHKPQFRFNPSLSSSRPSFRLSASISSDSSNYEREEVRWVREEQRWMREEQRWLREEKRWDSEREKLMREISELKLKIEALDRERTPSQGTVVAETIASLASMLQVLKEGDNGGSGLGRIAESGTGPSPIVLEVVDREEEDEMVVREEAADEVVVKEIRVVERDDVGEVQKVKRKVLKIGAEGKEVKELHEALEKLGFYSGEEDTEFSSFSDGTARAVKTWQCSIGVPEDGIMTAELLEWLYSDKIGDPTSFSEQETSQFVPPAPFKEPENGAVIASLTQISKVDQKIVKDMDVTEVDLSDRRVFLLGENRWEEPSRLANRSNQSGGSKKTNTATICTLCNGQGRLLCMECDGTGEPNIEQQFLEWADEEMKCPYCEGVGHTNCDACDGKGKLN